MGRPLNKKYFANTNYQDFGFANVGGEGVASVTIAAPIAASMNTGATVTFSAPQLTGGQTATGTVTIDGNGDIAAIAITSAGSGYTAVPTITVTDTVAGGAETASLTSGSGGVTVALTTGASARQNSIKCEAQVGAGTEVLTGNVIKQVSTKRYKITTSDGTAVCKLVQSATLGENEMSITATDANSNAYFVQKLTSRMAVLTRKVSGDGDFATGAKVKWTFGSATSDTVSIENQ
jgi:hypothetical protein